MRRRISPITKRSSRLKCIERLSFLEIYFLRVIVVSFPLVFDGLTSFAIMILIRANVNGNAAHKIIPFSYAPTSWTDFPFHVVFFFRYCGNLNGFEKPSAMDSSH